MRNNELWYISNRSKGFWSCFRFTLLVFLPLKFLIYIRNYAHSTPIFRLRNIHLVFSTCPHKYKWILCTENPVLNASFQNFLCTNINNHPICCEKLVIKYLKARNSIHAKQTIAIKYVFIVFFEKIRC